MLLAGPTVLLRRGDGSPAAPISSMWLDRPHRMQRHRERQRQRTGATAHEQPTVDGGEERADPSVLGTGSELHVERDRALDAFDLAQHDARRVAAQVVPQFIGIERHRLGQSGQAGARSNRRLEHHGPVEVASSPLASFDRGDGPMSGVGADESAEHRGRVEPRQARPVDRTIPRGQSRRVTIRQQCVLGDRDGAHEEW